MEEQQNNNNFEEEDGVQAQIDQEREKRYENFTMFLKKSLITAKEYQKYHYFLI